MGTRAERIVIAVPVAEEVVAQLRRAEPDVEWAWEPELLPPRRFPGDYAGPSGFRRGPVDQERFDALIDSADILFGIPDTSPAALLRTTLANPALGWVHTMAAGGGSQLRAAQVPPERLGTLAVTTSAGVHGFALAEFALLGVLAGLKEVPRWMADKASRHWPERAPVRQLYGATVLVLGTGGIGARVAEVFAACGAIVWGVARHPAAPTPPFARIVQAAALADALPYVDALVCALPGTDATHHLVDERVLSSLPPGAVVVNVGRGSVIDENALVGALRTGQVGFAALDVFETEPLPADSPLWGEPRVLVSPHTAALDTAEEQRIADLFLENLRRRRAGVPMRNLVDTVEFY